MRLFKIAIEECHFGMWGNKLTNSCCWKSEQHTFDSEFQSNAEQGKISTSYLFNAYVWEESWTQQKTSSTRFKRLKFKYCVKYLLWVTLTRLWTCLNAHSNKSVHGSDRLTQKSIWNSVGIDSNSFVLYTLESIII